MEIHLQKANTLNLEETAKLILNLGDKRTVLVQGDIGSGKSSLLKQLATMLPTHIPVYFDCTTKDVGDIMIPKISAGGNDVDECVKFIPNEEMGIHLGKPIILMIDEFGKGNRGVQNALAKPMLERSLAGYQLHPDSIVFATTNLTGEGVGDLLQAHHRNRITTVRMAKPTPPQWTRWAALNDVDPACIQFTTEYPQVFQSYEEVVNPEDNLYIYHPQAERDAFVTHRSMEAASDIVKLRDVLSEKEILAALTGTIGEHAARDLVAFTALSDQLPTLEAIKNSPQTAIVPDNAAATCMVMYKLIASVERDWFDKCFAYLERVPKEAQVLFINAVSDKKHPQNKFVVMYNKYTKWCHDNHYLFA